MNREHPDVQAGFRKGRGTRDQVANIRWIMEKGREFQKNICFCFIDYAEAFDCVDHNKLWKILKEMGISDHLTCLLRNPYAGQEGTVRIGHGTTNYTLWLSHFSRVQLCATPWTAAYQAPLPMGFSRQDYWSTRVGCHCLLQQTT